MGPQSFDCGSSVRVYSNTPPLHRASMGPQSFDCGSARCAGRKKKADLASMGPQSFDCGSAGGPAVSRSPVSHASMGPQSFDCGSDVDLLREFDISPGFNWAAVFLLRRSRNAYRTLWSVNWLQWGRSLSTAEVPRTSSRDATADAASMGPQSFDCGSSSKFRVKSCAPASLQWGRSLSTAE